MDSDGFLDLQRIQCFETLRGVTELGIHKRRPLRPRGLHGVLHSSVVTRFGKIDLSNAKLSNTVSGLETPIHNRWRHEIVARETEH